MSIDNLNIVSFFDKTRHDNGISKLKIVFNELIKNNIEKALNLINDENLHFASLFLLKSDIKKFNLFSKLNLRNRIALETVNDILTKKISDIEYLSDEYIRKTHLTLKWILETGFIDDGIDNKYDKVLDTVAALLTMAYKDKTILPILVNMIFERYKKRLLIHDLIWAFFESRNPETLTLIAKYLRSSKLEEFELACKLLNFVPGIDIDNKENKEEQYKLFTNWFEENYLFFYFTGESFQQTSHPKPYIVVLEAKYICESVSVDTGKILKTLSKEDEELLNRFRELEYENKILLSDFSYKIYGQNKHFWKKWLNYPITDQIKIAKNGIGGEL